MSDRLWVIGVIIAGILLFTGAGALSCYSAMDCHEHTGMSVFTCLTMQK